MTREARDMTSSEQAEMRRETLALIARLDAARAALAAGTQSGDAKQRNAQSTLRGK